MTEDIHARQWRGRRILGVGEAMIEFAAVGDDLYRRGFAGDTLNTCWHMAQLLGDRGEVGYLTRVGTDAFSNQLIDFVAANGMDASKIERDPLRTIGLYVISLAGAERSFSYWRETSAARRLADDVEALGASVKDCALIHVSGITLGVIGETGRQNLFRALAAARAAGAVISFDPNVRLRLWTDVAELKAATRDMFAITDIALPSFDDEALVWGDADPEATVTRIAALGVDEIVVKNGADDVSLQLGDESWRRRRPRRPTFSTRPAPETLQRRLPRRALHRHGSTRGLRDRPARRRGSHPLLRRSRARARACRLPRCASRPFVIGSGSAAPRITRRPPRKLPACASLPRLDERLLDRLGRRVVQRVDAVAPPSGVLKNRRCGRHASRVFYL